MVPELFDKIWTRFRGFYSEDVLESVSVVKGVRRWKLWQVEPAISCNLKCIMCPWKGIRDELHNERIMSPDVWELLTPHLGDVESIDFTGGGEPLLQKNLFKWMKASRDAGCRTGFLTNGFLLDEQMIYDLLGTDPDWLGFSVDGADSRTYEDIRQGSNFFKVCDNIRCLTNKRTDSRPLVMMNFVIMNKNRHQILEMVKLAEKLGVDHVNFKQCDVIRDGYGRGLGVFAGKESKETRKIGRELKRAARIARTKGIKTTFFSLIPQERPVCVQDPRKSLFIRYDGVVTPCINLAYGGASVFLDTETVFPNIHYGLLQETSLTDIWNTEPCQEIRQLFRQREDIHDKVLASSDFGRDVITLNRALQRAIDAMPEAPKGCASCHYLFDI